MKVSAEVISPTTGFLFRLDALARTHLRVREIACLHLFSRAYPPLFQAGENRSQAEYPKDERWCFPHDIRLGAWPLSRALAGDSSPEAIAKMIFYLNYSQSRDRY
jgi:hypothetical protein